MGILFPNLIENALKHGAQDGLVEAVLTTMGLLCVANYGPALPAKAIDRVMLRFEYGDGNVAGSGFGFSIVKAIADRTGMAVTVVSPRLGMQDGVQVQVKLPFA